MKRGHTARDGSGHGVAAAWIAVWSVLSTGCGAPGQQRARALARQQLACRGPALRVEPIGQLVVRPRAPVTFDLYDAQGCGGRELYLCFAEGARCAAEPAALPPELAAPAARALHLRRTVSRARCPPSQERVVQESESLWRFEACDGRWTLHCRGETCEPLP